MWKGIKTTAKLVFFGYSNHCYADIGVYDGFQLSGEISRALDLSVENILAKSGGCAV